MAGACPPALSVAVIKAGGIGACGALTLQPDAIETWAAKVRAETDGPFQINLWVPDPPPQRDATHEAALRAFLAQWGPAIPPEAADATPPDFAAQCASLLQAKPAIASSIMGLFPPAFVTQLKEAGIAWWATVTTLDEALQAQAAGADALIAQGAEAGGHRGTFHAAQAEATAIGLFALIPALADAVHLPLIATGGITDARTAAAATLLGATAVQVGTAFLRCPEAALHPAWTHALATTPPEATHLTRAYSGRLARAAANAYVRAATSPGAPAPAPYPVQRALTQPMREDALTTNAADRMQSWAGQSCMRTRALPAAQLVIELTDAMAANRRMLA